MFGAGSTTFVRNLATTDGEDLDPALQAFASAEFDPKRFVKEFYGQKSDAQAKAFCLSLLEGKSRAAQQLQRKVFKYYPRLIASSRDLREMGEELGRLRRNLGKSDFVLSSIERASQRLAKLNLEPRTDRSSTETKINVNDLADTPSRGSERAQLQATLEISRFKKIQALLSNETYPQKWIVEAPNDLKNLLHNNDFRQAVALIECVRDHVSQQSSAKTSSPHDTEQELKDANDKSGEDTYDAEAHLGEELQMESDVNECESGILPYMESEKKWAVDFALQVIESEAFKLAAELVAMLEQDRGTAARTVSSVQRRRSGSLCESTQNGNSAQQSMKLGSRRRNSSIISTTTIDDHPARLLSQLGSEESACAAFLRGKSSALKRLIDEIIQSPLASQPEQCVVELAQTVFGCVLDTHSEFRLLFPLSAGNEQLQSMRDVNTGEDNCQVLPNTLLSSVMVWSRDQISSFLTNFVRFLLPGCALYTTPQMLQGENDQVTAELLDDAAAVPFVSEKENTPFSVVLSNDEWRALGNCLRWTLLLCRRLERDGVSLGFLVARQLSEPINTALDSIFVQVERRIRFHLKSEAWQAEQLRVETRESADKSVLSLTSSGQRVYELVHDMIRKIKRVYSTNYSTTSAALEAKIISRVVSILRTYMESVVHAAGAWPVQLEGSCERFQDLVLSQTRRGEGYQAICGALGSPTLKERRVVHVLMCEPHSSSQHLGMIASVLYISSDLTLRVKENFEKLFKRPVPALRELSEWCGDIERDDSPLRLLCDAFVVRQSRMLLEDVLQWSHFDYSSGIPSGKQAGSVSPNFERLGTAISELKTKSLKALGNHPCSLDMVASITEHMLVKLEADGTPSAIFGPVEGEHNRQQINSDLHMLLNLPLTLMDREPSESAVEIVKLILENV